MTIKEHEELYKELQEVIFNKDIKALTMTETQQIFVIGLEDSAFNIDFLKSYAELVSAKPDISIRNLHAYCIGFGLGASINFELDETKVH